MEYGFDDVLRVNGINAQGFGTIAKLVMRDKRLAPEAKAIYAYICSFAGSGTTAYPSVILMCDELGMSETRLTKHRKQLEEFDLIKITRERRSDGKLGRNEYEVVMRPNPSPQNEGMEPTPQNLGMDNLGMENEGVIIINSSITNSSIKKELESKKVTFDSIIAESFPDSPTLRDAMIEYVKMRKMQKKVPTDNALRLAIKELRELTADPDRQLKIIEQSIVQSWTAFYDLKENYGGKRQVHSSSGKPKIPVALPSSDTTLSEDELEAGREKARRLDERLNKGVTDNAPKNQHEPIEHDVSRQ